MQSCPTASRGISPEELRSHDLWWNGPPWLLQDPVQVPPQPQASELACHLSTEEKQPTVYTTTIKSISWWEHKYK